MKRLFILLLSFLFISVFFANGQTSCRVYGADDYVVTVDNPMVKIYGDNITFRLSLNKKAKEKIGISVAIYDSCNNNVANTTVYINSGSDQSVQRSVEIPKECRNNGNIYYIRLSSASCSDKNW